MSQYTFESSGAFIEQFTIKPYHSGLLDGLKFAVKDNINMAGYVTGFGNPSWKAMHAVETINAFCVDQILWQGATCVGKTICDEFTYSLLGENLFYGTPINPMAPDRIPGGSSSGSASAVACGLVDFALSSDTGGSIRIPANNCGIWGYRPTFGRVSLGGVLGFAASFDTVGLHAATAEVLYNSGMVLCGGDVTRKIDVTDLKIYLLQDVFDICDKEVVDALIPKIEVLKKNFYVETISLKQILERSFKIESLFRAYAVVQGAEIWSTLGNWFELNKPELGAVAEYNFYHIAKTIDRSQLQACYNLKEWFGSQINHFLNKNQAILCFPTAPQLPPKLGELSSNPEARSEGNYFPRTLGINAIAAFARAPQISMPLAESNGIPVGLSVLAANGDDETILHVAKNFCDQ